MLDLKGIAYQIDPIVPFFGNDRFTEISPLRRIPVYSRRQGHALRLHGDLRVPRRSPSRAGALSARAGRSRARALARGVRRHAHGRGDHLAPVQPGGDQPARVRRADRRGGAAQDARGGAAARARLPRVAAPRAGLPVRRDRHRRHRDRGVLPQRRVLALPASTPRAGRAPRRSSIARSATSASRSSSRSRRRRCACRRPSSAPRSRPPARRSRAETLGTDAPPRRGIMSI